MTKSSGQSVNLDNCVSVITGGGSGIGRSVAMELAKATPSENRSSTRIVVSDIRFEAAQEVVTSLEKLGATAVAFECDVSNEEDVVKLANKTKSTFGKLNLLFNVAGVNLVRKLHETSSNDVEWLFSVNVFGMCHMVRHFVPLLKAAAGSETAHIVNVSSGFGLAVPSMGPVQPSAYAGTKHAVVGLSDAMRKELAPDCIGLSVVCPGVVNTDAWNSMSFRQARFGGPKQGTAESKERLKAWGQDPKETANLVLAGLCRGDFFILPLDDAGRSSMRTEIEERYGALRSALEKSYKP
ncbi:MAG: SDR family oxidoreductase [Gammaproteobacteria bacterium]|nr:SDR family oxidoreductase [Gammaproteobacteria bacterium]MDP7271412.1 SDR family oxidoreductase [Gammaproteobacteria bacterium]HJP05390.1 SDR family oxidoreductase [Gammaproteobacteria bacterium]